MTPSRRDVLQLVGGAAATVGAAGSVTAQEEPDGDLPAYGEWLAIDDGGLEFVALDWTTLEGVVEDELEQADPGEEVPPEFEADPMIAPASEGLLSAYFFVALDLGQYRLGGLLEADAFESTVGDLLLTDDALVVRGAIDPAEIDERVTAEPEAEFFRQLERTDEIDGYDVYEPVTDDVDAAIAVDDEALVVVDGENLPPDEGPLTVLETTIGVAAGDVERATDESETVAWLLESAGDGDVTVGQYGDRVGAGADESGIVDLTFEGLEDAEGIVSSLTVDDEETLTGEFAAIVPDPDEAALEDLIGASADEQSVGVDGDRVTATATWRDEQIR